MRPRTPRAARAPHAGRGAAPPPPRHVRASRACSADEGTSAKHTHCAGDAPVPVPSSTSPPALASPHTHPASRALATFLAGLASLSAPVLSVTAHQLAPQPQAAATSPSTLATLLPPAPPLQELAAVRDRYERAAAVRSRWRQENDAAKAGGGGGSGAAVTPTSSRRPSSPLPSTDEADAMSLLYDRSSFTEDAWAAMQILRTYARYVDTLTDLEASVPGATARREALEKVWQTVAHEWSPPPTRGHARPFAVAAWAARLQPALAAAGGVLRSDGELHAAASDLTASLGDRYTEFLPPSAYRLALRRPTAGELAYATAQAGGGVGILVDGPAEGVSGGFLHHPSRARGARVAAVAAESAAEAAGVRAGDALLEVDRYAVDRLPDSAVAALLRGPAGADVAVTIAPSDGAPPRRLTLERRPLPQPPVKAATMTTRSGRSVAYLRLHYVSGDATAAMASALTRLETENVDGIVLDLRNNPGGVFEEGVATAALLLPDGAPIATFDRGGGSGGGGGSTTQFVAGRGNAPAAHAAATPASDRTVATHAPLAILVNRGTASAAELVAGALADSRPHATLLGERSFGKGVVQYYFPLPSTSSLPSSPSTGGGGVRVTVGAYTTPRGRQPTADHGLTPDNRCEGTPAGPGAPDPGRDACVAAGLDAVDRAAARWW